MHTNKHTGLVHSNGEPCPGGKGCIRESHFPGDEYPGLDARAGFGKPDHLSDDNLLLHAKVLESQLLDLSCALVALSGLIRNNRPLRVALKISTVLTHGAYELVSTALSTPPGQDCAVKSRDLLGASMVKVTELSQEIR